MQLNSYQPVLYLQYVQLKENSFNDLFILYATTTSEVTELHTPWWTQT